MKKLEQGMLSLEGSDNVYLVQLFSNNHKSIREYVCKVYQRKGLFNKQVFEKSFFTVFPDFISMAHSTLINYEMFDKHEREQLHCFRQYINN